MHPAVVETGTDLRGLWRIGSVLLRIHAMQAVGEGSAKYRIEFTPLNNPKRHTGYTRHHTCFGLPLRRLPGVDMGCLESVMPKQPIALRVIDGNIICRADDVMLYDWRTLTVAPIRTGVGETTPKFLFAV